MDSRTLQFHFWNSSARRMAFTFVYVFCSYFPLTLQLNEASVLFALTLIMASAMTEFPEPAI